MSAPDPGDFGPERSRTEEGLLVGKGTFKVDRAHALKKLKLYQLPASVGGWLLWLRCAAASGERQALVKFGASDFSVTFGGAPFSRAELEDPFAPLFTAHSTALRAEAAGPGRERGFTLALGLLQALASSPKEASIESGSGAGRVRLTARSLEDFSLTPALGPETATRLSVTWPLASESQDRFLNQGYLGFRAVPLFHGDRLAVTGMGWDRWPPEGSAGRSFSLGAALGRVGLPAFYTPPDSHLTLYKLGVYVCEHREPLRWAKVQAWVNDDKLSLSAAQTGVVSNTRFKSLMRLVAREAEAMALAVAREHPGLMGEARRAMLEEPAKRVWDTRMQWGRQAGENLASPSLFRRLLVPGTAERARIHSMVLEAAERTVWLRDVASRLKAPGRTTPAGLADAVRTALEGNERPV